MKYEPKRTHREQDGERIPCGCPKIQISWDETRVAHVDGCRDAGRDKIRTATSKDILDAEYIDED